MRGEDQAEKMGLHELYVTTVEVKSFRCKQGFYTHLLVIKVQGQQE